MKDPQNTEALIQLWLDKTTEALAAVPVLMREGFKGVE